MRKKKRESFELWAATHIYVYVSIKFNLIFNSMHEVLSIARIKSDYVKLPIDIFYAICSNL